MAEGFVLAYRARTPAEAQLALLLLNAAGIVGVVSDRPPETNCGLQQATLDSGREVFVEEDDAERARWTISNSGRIIPPRKSPRENFAKDSRPEEECHAQGAVRSNARRWV